MSRILDVYLHEIFAGQLIQNDSGGLSFTYDENYVSESHAPPAFALSLSLPLREEPFFLAGSHWWGMCRRSISLSARGNTMRVTVPYTWRLLSISNCYDNAVAESFFHLLKKERIRRKAYSSRKQARADIFDYIEFFYNPKRKHGKNGMLSPIDFERQQKWKQQGV